MELVRIDVLGLPAYSYDTAAFIFQRMSKNVKTVYTEMNLKGEADFNDLADKSNLKSGKSVRHGATRLLAVHDE